MPQSQADQQQSTPVGASTGGSKTPTPEGSPTSIAVAVAAAAPPGYVNVAGVVVHKDGLVANPGLRALEANPTAVGQWCPRNDDPTHAVLGCNRLHKNAHAAAVGTNAGLPPPASPATTTGRPVFPNQLPATTASVSAAGPGSGPGPTTDQPPPMASLSALPTGGAPSTSQHPTLLTETQRRAAIGAAVSSGGAGGGFRRPMGGEKLRKNQIASQILRAASDTSGPPIVPASAAVTTLPPTFNTGAAAASAPLALPHSPASTNTAVNSQRNSQRNMSFGNINSDNVGEGVAGSQITSRSSLSRSVNAGGTTTTLLNQQADQSGSSSPNTTISVSHQLRADLHPHYTAHGGGGHNGNDDVVDPRSFQAKFPHVVHMCVAHTFNLEDMMTLFRDDLDYQCEMCYDVLHVWREGAGGEGGGSSAMKLDHDGDDVIHRESSALIREDDERNASHHEHHTTTTTSKKNRRGPGHHHRSHHRRGPRVGEGNPRASAVSMRKPFNLFLFQYGSVVFWGSPEVYAEIVEPFISDSVGTGGGSGGQASNLRSGGAQRGGTTTDTNTTNNRGKKAAHRIVVALERAMGQRYPKDVILDRFPVRCSYEIAAFGSSDHAGPMGNQQQQTTLQPIVMGQQQLSGTYGEEPHITAGEAAAREAEMFKRSLLRNHHFIIPAVSDSIPMLCIAHALAQAAKVDVLEGMISQLMEQCHPLPTQLKDDGFVRITEKHLLQLRGEVLFYRMQLRGGSDLQAEPEPIWHFPAMETFYLITREVFEVEKLIDVLDSKLDAGNEILSVLSDQFSQRHSSRLEWIVIWLVFVEVIIGVLELILDMKPWFK